MTILEEKICDFLYADHVLAYKSTNYDSHANALDNHPWKR